MKTWQALLTAATWVAAACAISFSPVESRAQNVPGHCTPTPYSGPCDGGGNNSNPGPSPEDRWEAREYSRYISAYNRAIHYGNKAAGFSNTSPATAIPLYQNALAEIEEALRHESNDADALTLRRRYQAWIYACNAKLAVLRGEYDQGIALYRNAEQLYPEANNTFEQNIAWAEQVRQQAEQNALHNQEVQRAADAARSQQQADLERQALQQQQALRQQDANAAANLSSTIDNLDANIKSKGATTGAFGLPENGKGLQFTPVHPHPSVSSTVFSELPAISAASGQAAQQAATGTGDENAKADAAHGFVDGATPNGSLAPAVITGHAPVLDPAVNRHLDNSVIQKYLAQKAAAETQYRDLDRQLTSINAQIKNSALPQGTREQLATVAAKLTDQQETANSAIAAAYANANETARQLDLSLKMTETPAKAKPQEPPSPSPNAGTQPKD